MADQENNRIDEHKRKPAINNKREEKTDKSCNRKNRRRIGSDYEEMAASYLEQKGYFVLERNFRCKIGEIDIVAREGRYLVFVEVKYRKNESNGNPLEAVDWRKQEVIRSVAAFYLKRYGYSMDTPCRFDVIGITGEEIRLVRNAF